MTITAWRLLHPKWLDSAFDGEGARLTGGRWNSKGVPLVYLSSNLALAALELLVHIDYHRALSTHCAIQVHFDEHLALHVKKEQLPVDWSSAAAIPETQALGDAWANSKASAVLAVPSVVIPQEFNYLLNPKHPDAKEVSTSEPETFRYDARLLKSL